MLITCKINNEYTFNLLNWNIQDFKNESILELETADLITVKEIFKNLNLIEIFFDENLIASYTQYDNFENIEFVSNVYDDRRSLFVDILRIKVTKRNLIDTVEELERTVNNIIDIDSMTAQEYKEYITALYSAQGQQEIFDGCEVLLSDGSVAWFTYNFEDQLNLLSALYTVMLVQDLTTLIPYHSHLSPCRMYLAADIVKIYMGLQSHSILVQTRVNMLNNWIRSLNYKEDMINVKYDSELPSPYAEQYDTVIETTGDLLFSIIERFFPEQQEASFNEGEN